MKKKHTNSQPLVSIITPLFNASTFIAQTIRSVQDQSYENWEHIIIDDLSTDNSVHIVKTLAAQDDRIQLVCNPTNQGAAVTRNQATELARGAYIAFLDSDDLWHSEKLERQVLYMEEHHASVCYTSYLQIDETGNLLGKRIKALPILSYKKQHTNNYVGNLTGMYNASKLGKIFAPNIRKRQDWAVWLEAIKKSGKPALGIQKDLAYYRVRKGSISSNKLNLVKYNFRFYRDYLGYTQVKSFGCLLRFFWEYFFIRPKYIERM